MKLPEAHGACFLLVLFLAATVSLLAGIRREIQNAYVQNYENKAMFLKFPVRGSRQVIHVRDTGPVLDRGNTNLPLFFQVGDQVRVIKVDFGGDSVRFRIASVDLRKEGEVIFQFPRELTDDFAQRGAFDSALRSTFTEGLTYEAIDSAKEEFVQGELDEFVDRLVRSSNTSREFVVEMVGKKLPAYQSLKEEVERTRNQLQRLEESLNEEKRSRQQAQAELSRLRQEAARKDSDLTGLQAERDKLAGELKQLRQTTRDYEQQMKQLVSNLNVREASAETLSKQIEALNKSINALRDERVALSRRLADANQQMAELRNRNERLAQELKQTQREKQKLFEDVTALTSGRNTLEARYMDVKKQKETLEKTRRLGSALRLEKRLVERDAGVFQVADLYLLTRKIGTFEIPVPQYPGSVYEVRFAADSPDIVKFSQEERELYGLLGEKLQLETGWNSTSGDLKTVLLNKAALQAVTPRETIDWPWLFQGEIDQPERVSLNLQLVGPDGQKIFLGSHDFTLQPGHMWARFRQFISPVSLAAGMFLGIVFFGLVFGFRRRSPSSQVKKREPSTGNVVLHKKL